MNVYSLSKTLYKYSGQGSAEDRTDLGGLLSNFKFKLFIFSLYFKKGSHPSDYFNPFNGGYG